MRNLAALAAFAASILSSAALFAQSTDEEPAAPASAPPPRAASPAPSPSSAPVPTEIKITIPLCRLGEHAGIEDADAQTAATIVCAEVVHAGAQPDAHYRVTLGRLGSIVILGVAREGAQIGDTVDARTIRLTGIEEVPVAAPRLAESIVSGTPLKETEKVDNLVGEDTRTPKSKPGKTHFTLGLIGMLPPLDSSLSTAPGAALGFHSETTRYEIGGDMRFGGNNEHGTAPDMSFFMLSIGGRYFASDADVSPYFGGGLAWEYLDLKIPANGFHGDDHGIGAYADAGCEVMRTHHAHLALGVRLDLPFFTLHGENQAVPLYTGSGGYNYNYTPPTPNTVYYAPLSFEARLTF